MSPIPDPPTPSPSDGTALPQHSGDILLGALHAMMLVGTFYIFFITLAGCFYLWSNRPITSSNGTGCCPNLRKLFLCCHRASSGRSNDGSTVAPATSRPSLPQPSTHTHAIDHSTRASQNTCIGEGTDAPVADSEPQTQVYGSIAAREIGEAPSEDMSSHVNSEHNGAAGSEIHAPTNPDAGDQTTRESSELSSDIFKNVRGARRSSSFLVVGADCNDGNAYGKSVWSEDSKHRTTSASPESRLSSTSNDSPDFCIGTEEEQAIEDANRSYDFSLQLVGASNRPGSFLGIPGPTCRPSTASFSPSVKICTHPVDRARTLPVHTGRYRPPTPLPWSPSPRHRHYGRADVCQLVASASIPGNDLDITQSTEEDANVSPSPMHGLEHDGLADMTEYAGVDITEAPQLAHYAESSIYSKEDDIQQETDQVTNADTSSYAQVFASGVDGSSSNARNALMTDTSALDARKIATPDNFTCEPEDIGSARNIMSAILSALRDDSVEFRPSFVYSDDDESVDARKCDSSRASSSPSCYSSEESSGCTSGKRSSLFASIMSSKGSAADGVVVSDSPIVIPFVRIHRRTGAVFIRVKYKGGRLGSELSFEDVFAVYNVSAATPVDTRWASVDGMMVVKVFVPATDDIWKVRVPEDISLQRFTSRVLSKLGFHVAFSGSCFDGPEYYFRDDETFHCWLDKRIRNGRNLPIVSHVIDPPSSPRSYSVDIAFADTTATTAATADSRAPEDPSLCSHRNTLVQRISVMADIFHL